MEAILGRKRLRHPMDHSDNNDCLVAMATRRQKCWFLKHDPSLYKDAKNDDS